MNDFPQPIIPPLPILYEPRKQTPNFIGRYTVPIRIRKYLREGEFVEKALLVKIYA